MKLPEPIKHALVEAMISQYTEDHPSSRTRQGPLTFTIPCIGLQENIEIFGITNSDIQATITENPDSLAYSEDSDSIQFIPPFTRTCNLYDKVLAYIKDNTSSNPKFTITYDPAIKESLIYNFFTGSVVLMVPEGMSDLSQLKFALMTQGSKLRSIIDMTGGWVYVFPKYIMQSDECGKMPAKDTNVQQVLASYLEDIFP